MQTTQEQNCVS